VVEHISHRVAVMYLGRLVELATAEALYRNPLHPYTEALLSAIPVPDPTTKVKRIILPGDVPSPIDPPKGCRFHPRCPHRFEPCDGLEPQLTDVGNGHQVACYLHTANHPGARP
jgi:oligopeptide/dipeptide ABC transporter ATP-binding protein